MARRRMDTGTVDHSDVEPQKCYGQSHLWHVERLISIVVCHNSGRLHSHAIINSVPLELLITDWEIPCRTTLYTK